MKISVKSSRMVKPQREKPSTTLWISNLDALLPDNLHIFTLYYYASSGADDFLNPAVLEASLSRALVEFYPMAGRVKMANGRVEIDCNGEGALLVEAECDGSLHDFGDFRPRTDVALFPHVDYSRGISSFPLFLAQVSRLKCGGVILGVAIYHQLIDGISSVHFINTWSDIARGLEVGMPPYLDRHLLSARKPPQPEFTHVEFLPPPTLKNSKTMEEEFKFSTFKLTRDQLNALKAHCNEHAQNKEINYSTFEVLTGHLWVCLNKARGLQKDQESNLNIIIDVRSRMQPPLPPGFFGNAIYRATNIAVCGELETAPLHLAVSKVRETVRRMSDGYLRSAIDYLEVRGCADPVGRGTNLYASPNLAVTSWVRLPLYQADFGWGPPVHVGLRWVPAEGVAFLLPTPTSDNGAIMVGISMTKEQLHVFQQLFYQNF